MRNKNLIKNRGHKLSQFHHLKDYCEIHRFKHVSIMDVPSGFLFSKKKKNENQTLKNSKQMNSLLPKFSSVISHSKNSNWLPANDRVEY